MKKILITQRFQKEVIALSSESERLVTLRFNCAGVAMWSSIYAYGRPVQYSYMKNDLALWSVQTAYAARPWAMEMPSAGQPLAWSVILEVKRRGARLAWLTHAAGLSAVSSSSKAGRIGAPAALRHRRHAADPRS